MRPSMRKRYKKNRGDLGKAKQRNKMRKYQKKMEFRNKVMRHG